LLIGFCFVFFFSSFFLFDSCDRLRWFNMLLNCMLYPCTFLFLSFPLSTTNWCRKSHLHDWHYHRHWQTMVSVLLLMTYDTANYVHCLSLWSSSHWSLNWQHSTVNCFSSSGCTQQSESSYKASQTCNKHGTVSFKVIFGGLTLDNGDLLFWLLTINYFATILTSNLLQSPVTQKSNKLPHVDGSV